MEKNRPLFWRVNLAFSQLSTAVKDVAMASPVNTLNRHHAQNVGKIGCSSTAVIDMATVTI